MTAVYDASAHEPLTETPWDDAWVDERVAAIVADAESSLDGIAWPTHPNDVDPDDPPHFYGIYLGTAGMVWALGRLGSSLDLKALAGEALAAYREAPDSGEVVPGLWMGESGVLLAARSVGSAAYDEARLAELVVENERNKTWEVMWGSPGTMLAARAAGLDAEYERSAAILVEQWDASPTGLWTQDLYGRIFRFTGPAHGFAGNVHALRGYLADDELRRRIEAPLRAYSVLEDGFVNWVPTDEEKPPSRLQWCHGAAGMVATLGDLLPYDLLVGGAELTWHAGPLAKGPGLCHGTAGNGYAFLRMHELTGDEVWLERARRFAVHSLEQVERTRAEVGRGRYTLFTGDVGAALYARACRDVDPRFPTMDVW